MEEDYDEEVFNYFVKTAELTKDEEERVLSNDEMKELCRRKSCRVDMWRWNLVHDHYRKLQQKGRLQHKSQSKVLAFLTKAVNRHKIKYGYRQEEIDQQRLQTWRARKKDSLLLIDLLKSDSRIQTTQRNTRSVQTATNSGDFIRQTSSTHIYEPYEGPTDNNSLEILNTEVITESVGAVSVLQINTEDFERPHTQSVEVRMIVEQQINKTHRMQNNTQTDDCNTQIYNDFMEETVMRGTKDSQNLFEEPFSNPAYEDFGSRPFVTSTQSQNAKIK